MLKIVILQEYNVSVLQDVWIRLPCILFKGSVLYICFFDNNVTNTLRVKWCKQSVYKMIGECTKNETSRWKVFLWVWREAGQRCIKATFAVFQTRLIQFSVLLKFFTKLWRQFACYCFFRTLYKTLAQTFKCYLSFIIN